MTYTTIIDADTAALHGEDAGWLFVDCRCDIRQPARGLADYSELHVKGAVFADLDRDLSGTVVPGKTGRHPLPGKDDLVETLSRLGVGEGTQVVAYDASTGALAAARLWWLLRWAGHGAVAVLDGGLREWRRRGLPTAPGVETRQRRQFPPRFRDHMVVDARGVEAAALDPAWVVVDVRSADRYRGENETIDPVAGHIAGAVSAPYADALAPEGKFKPAHDLAAALSPVAGARGPERTIVYCGSGVTAAHAALSFTIAGLGTPLLYPGSWSEWITDPRRPVAR